MTVDSAYKIVTKKIPYRKFNKYAAVKDGFVFVAVDELELVTGIPTMENNYYLVTNSGDVQITNPFLCELDDKDLKQIL